MSAFVDPSEFGGRSLVYLPRYAPASDEYFTLSDDEVRERFVRAIAKMYPGFRSEDVMAFRVSRVRNVFPIPSLAYSEHVPPVATSIPGVFAVSSAHIVNGTLNVNETVQLAERTVEQLTRAARSGATS
jgi:protoporphyrinogen oxidase